MGDLMERVAIGVIEDLNPILGYIQIGVPGRGSRIAIVGEGTTITRMIEVPREELTAGDEVAVSGTPTVVIAERVQIGAELTMMDVFQALQEDTSPGRDSRLMTQAPQGAGESQSQVSGAAPAGPGFISAQGGSPIAPSVTLSGKVKSVDPLVVTLNTGAEVAVQLPEGIKVLRRVESDLMAAVVEEPIVAVGQVNEDGYLEATRVYLGERVSMGRTGFGRGRGGGPLGFPMSNPPAGGQGQ